MSQATVSLSIAVVQSRHSSFLIKLGGLLVCMALLIGCGDTPTPSSSTGTAPSRDLNGQRATDDTDVGQRVDPISKARQEAIASRPASESDYFPLATRDDWRWVYASRQTDWSDEQIADFLIPGHYQQKDAFKKRELFGQLSAVKAQLSVWAARQYVVVEREHLGDAAPLALSSAYDFDTGTYAINAPMCVNRAYRASGVPYRFLTWDTSDCVVHVEEQSAQRIEPLRADRKLHFSAKVYLRALDIAPDNALELVAHKVELAIRHRPTYAMRVDQMDILDTVMATSPGPR